MTRRKKKEIRKKRTGRTAKPKLARKQKELEPQSSRSINYLAEEHPEL